VSTFAEVLYGVEALAMALFIAAAYAVCYIALEPYVRRRWPQSLVTWARLLEGRVRDPLVGGHVLVGCALGVGFTLMIAARAIVLAQRGVVPSGTLLPVLVGAAPAMGEWFSELTFSSGRALGLLFIFFLLRAIFRRNWLAATVFLAVIAAISVAFQSAQPAIVVSFAITQIALMLGIMIRFGLLPMVVAIIVGGPLYWFPVTSDFSAWYAGRTLFVLALVVILAAWSFRVALGRRPLWKEDFLEN
jgi:serine/threonine-protein kinase